MNIKISFLILFFSFFISKEAAGQTVKMVNFEFDCYQKKEIISLPSEFQGPTYLPYDEGVVITFICIDSVNFSDSFDDFCIVTILCGTNMKLSMDNSYVPIVLKTSDKDTSYYSKKKNKYARKTYLKNYLIMYEQASIKMKEVLDKLIDTLKDNDEK